MGFGRELIMKSVIEGLATFILVFSYLNVSPSQTEHAAACFNTQTLNIEDADGNVTGTETVPNFADPKSTDACETALGGGDVFGAAITIGLTYMLIIGGLRTYANPAIHFGKAFQGTLGWIDALFFFLFQILGAFFGTIVNNIMFNEAKFIFGAAPTVTQVMTLVFFEGVYAMVICLITLRADDNATEKDEAKEQATAIAAAYTVGFMIFGRRAGGIFNPAIAFGQSIGSWTRGVPTTWGQVGFADYMKEYNFIWVHLLAPYVGAFASAVLLWLGSDKYGIFWSPKAQEQ